MKKSLLIFLLISIMVIPTINAAENYTPVNYVSDYANIIEDATEAQINTLAQEIEHNTAVEIAVLTILSLEGQEGQDIDQFAVETFHDWGVGKKDVDNGLLIVVAVKDHQWRIEVGYGLEPVITDAMAGRIGRANFVDNFRAGNYGKGIYGAVADVQKVIQNDSSVIAAYSDSNEEINDLKEIGMIFFALFLFVILSIVYMFFCHWFESLYTKKLPPAEVKKSEALLMPPSKALVWMLLVLITFAVVMYYVYNWALGFNFLVINLILTFTRRQVRKEGRSGGGGFRSFGGGMFGGGRGGFGGFGGGGSGGGGAGGSW